MNTKRTTLVLAALLWAAAATLAVNEARADIAYTWGDNQYGELGEGTQTNRSTPAPVTGLTSGVTAVAAGESYSLAVQNGGAYAWGDNTTGQLGDGTDLRRLLPVAVSAPLTSGVTAVAAGVSHSLAVQNGAVYAWGYNGNGALGNGTTNSSTTPVAVSAPLTSGVTAIAVGNQFSLAIKNGGVWAWGVNEVGEIGDGTMTNRSAPVAVAGLTSGVTAIAAGLRNSLAVQNGGVYAWGNNVAGQLGDGTTTIRTTPVAVLGLANGVTAVAAGKFHSLAVQNGHVYSWGANFDGDLGDGTTTNHITPAQIDPADLHNIIAVAAGQSSSYALSSDGSLWDWGLNGNGGLGLGNFQLDYLTPQHLLPPSGYKFTSIDAYAIAANFAIATLAAVPTVVPGDFNRDGHVNAADIALAMAALTDTLNYQTGHGLNDPTLFGMVADVNGDGSFNDADLQYLLTTLKTGGGSTDPVPEPPSWVLASLALAMVSGTRFYVRCVRNPPVLTLGRFRSPRRPSERHGLILGR